MATKTIGRNENIPFYFETLLAGVGFLELLQKNSTLSRMQVKPDRIDGSPRRIEDLTKFYQDGSVEVIQIKHTQAADTFTFSDLWRVNAIDGQEDDSGKKEGVDIFKFLKSWRNHRKDTSSVSLTILTNRKATEDFTNFLSDIVAVNKNTLKWKDFKKKHSTHLKAIETNCSAKPFQDAEELKNFVCSLRLINVSDIGELEKEISNKLTDFGVAHEERVDAFIGRITKIFISNNVNVLPSTVNELLGRLKTGLIQEILTPSNYVERTELEDKILEAIQSKKAKGGFVLLYAPSGSGKTVLLSKLAQKNQDFFPYFCRIRPFEAIKGKSGNSNTDRLKSSWFKADIIQRCYEFGLLPISVRLDDTDAYIDKTFDEALNILSKKALERKDKKIVIIIDALDQVDTDSYQGKSVLDAIPANTYPGIVFLLSTWGEKYLPSSVKDLSQSTKDEIHLDIYFSEIEIKNYFTQANIKLTQDQIAIIKKQTKGLAISLLYLSKKLSREVSLDLIIASLSEHTEVFDWYKPIWNHLSDMEKECLGYLCFHFAKISRKHLYQLMQGQLNIAAFNSLIGKVEHFLDMSGGTMQPYHDSFRRFVTTRLGAERKIYHQKLYTYYSQNTSDPYAQKYLIKHLETVGFGNPSVKDTFKKLHQEKFYGRILKSKMDDSTKVEIGKSFVEYFYRTKQIENLVQYAVIISNIYPMTYDNDLFDKIRIGTEKLVLEVENELFLPKGDNPWNKREWLFKRISVGNILMSNDEKNSVLLGQRFIDDGMFRISLDRELIWGKDHTTENNFWHNADTYTSALVNSNKYRDAVAFLRNISFVEPRSSLVGFMSSKLADVHIQNLSLNPKETQNILSKAPKIERLVTYMELQNRRLPIPNKKDFKNLLKNERNERFLTNDQSDNQILDLAESLIIQGISDTDVRIGRLLKRVKIDLPYWSHGAMWGNSSGIFLRWLALKRMVVSDFDFKAFYTKELKEKFSHNKDGGEEYKNEHFLDLLIQESEVRKNTLLAKTGRLKWSTYTDFLDGLLKRYKEKLDKLKADTDSYYSDADRKEIYPYTHNLHFFLAENLSLVDQYFPEEILNILDKFELVFGADILSAREGLLERFVSAITPRTPLIKTRIEDFLKKSLELRQAEQSDNMTKSSNLRELAVLAAEKGFKEMGEAIFDQNLKYSRGLWSKEDPRVSNFIDTLRTQQSDQFKVALKHIEDASDVVEGSWNWRLHLLESIAYKDYKEALPYLYEFTIRGEVNHNDGLSRIINTCMKSYPYKSIHKMLPLLHMMDIKDEASYEFMGNISKSYSSLWGWALKNNDLIKAESLISDYIDCLNKNVEPPKRISLLKELRTSIEKEASLKTVLGVVDHLLTALDFEGYKEAPKSSSGISTDFDKLNIEEIKIAARKGEIESVISTLETYKKDNGYFTYKLINELVPELTYLHIHQIRKWATENEVGLERSELFSALIKKALVENNKPALKEVINEVFDYIKRSDRSYDFSEIIKSIDKVEFPNKKAFIKKIFLASIRKLAGDTYYLSQLFRYSSDQIDEYFIDLKRFSYPAWKEVVEKSMRLSLSK